MKIYRALQTAIITQKFGENLAHWYKDMGLKGHNGIDFSAKTGEPIYWDCDIRGVVLNTEIDSKGGLGVNVITETEEKIIKHRFWHLKEFKCVAGQILDSGDLIGIADSTGMSTNPHLHRDTKIMLKNSLGNYYVKEPNNGYGGCEDFLPFFTNIFIKDKMAQLEKQVSLLQKAIEIAKLLLKIKIELKIVK